MDRRRFLAAGATAAVLPTLAGADSTRDGSAEAAAGSTRVDFTHDGPRADADAAGPASG